MTMQGLFRGTLALLVLALLATFAVAQPTGQSAPFGSLWYDDGSVLPRRAKIDCKPSGICSDNPTSKRTEIDFSGLGGAGNPGGAEGQVQVNESGAFEGVSNGTDGQVLKSTGAGTSPVMEDLIRQGEDNPGAVACDNIGTDLYIDTRSGVNVLHFCKVPGVAGSAVWNDIRPDRSQVQRHQQVADANPNTAFGGDPVPCEISDRYINTLNGVEWWCSSLCEIDPGPCGATPWTKLSIGAAINFNGLVAVDGVDTNEVTTVNELNSVLSSALLFESTDNVAITGDFDFGGGGLGIEQGTSPPSCTEGQLYFKTDGPSGQRLMGCEGTTFKVQGDGMIEINDLETDDPPNVLDQEIYIGNASGSGAWHTMSGDLQMSNTGAVILGDSVGVTAWTLGGTTLTGITVMGSSANPTTNATGEMAIDTNAWAAGRGTLEFYDETESVFVVATIASDIPENGQIPKYLNGTIKWEDDSTGGTPALTDVTDPVGDVSFTVDINEEVEFSYTGAFTTGNQFAIIQQTGDPSGGVLLDVRAADTDVTVLQVGDGTNGITVSQAGALTITGTGTIVATSGPNGNNCPTGEYALGVDGVGAAEGCTNAQTEIDSIVATHSGVASAHHTATVEVNDLETVDPASILINEVYIGTGTGAGAFAALSGDVTMNSVGVVTIDDATWLSEAELNTFAELDSQIADATLMHEGQTPGGELGGTWASPTIDDGIAVDNWTLTGGSVATSDIDLRPSTIPTPTVEGRVEWESDDDHLIVGDGSGGQVEFVPAEDIFGHATMTDSGNMTIDHNGLLNYAANQHVNHSGVTFSAGEGLSGGGTLTSNRTFDINLIDDGDAQTTTTSSESGLELSGQELGIIRGCSDGDHLLWDDTEGDWSCGPDATGGTPALSSVTDPVGDVSFTVDINEEVVFSYTGAFTAGNQFAIIQQTGDPSGGVLLDVRAADTNVTVLQVGDGTNGITVSQAGALTIMGTGTIVATSGDSANSFFSSGAVADSQISDALTIQSGAISLSSIILEEQGAGDPIVDGEIEWDSATETIKIGDDGVATLEFFPNPHTANTDAESRCGGATTYLDGDGGCNDLSSVYQPLDSELTTIAALTETSGNVIFAVGSEWTSDPTPAIDCVDCTNIPAAADLHDVGNVTLSSPGDGDVLCFTGTASASVNCALGGDVTATEDSGTLTVTIAANAIENGMMADNSIDSAEYTDGSIDPVHLATQKRSMFWGAGSMEVDGTNCTAAAAVALVTGGPNVLAIACADNDSATIEGSTSTPDGWDFQTVTFTLVLAQIAASTGAYEMDFEAQCIGNDEPFLAFAGTGEQPAAITLTADDDMLEDDTPDITLNGTTCAKGDFLAWRGAIDAAASVSSLETLAVVVGVKMEYGWISDDQ